MGRLFRFTMFALLPIAGAAPASACSVMASYQVPSNLELAEQADVILVGIAAQSAGQSAELMPQILISPVLTLKGAAFPPSILVDGYFSTDSREMRASNPRDLVNPNYGTLIGGCVRYTFRQGMLLVLFLVRQADGRLRLMDAPFARTAEDVPTLGAPWMRAAALYADISILPRARRRIALLGRRAALMARRHDPDAALLVADINRQLHRR